VSTFVDGSPPETAEWFFEWLKDVGDDFRIHKTVLAKIRFAVFGLGNSMYGPVNYNKVAKTLSKGLRGLGATPLCPIAFADESKPTRKFGNTQQRHLQRLVFISALEKQLDNWSEKITMTLADMALMKKEFGYDVTANLSENIADQKGEEVEVEDDDEDDEEDSGSVEVGCSCDDCPVPLVTDVVGRGISERSGGFFRGRLRGYRRTNRRQ
jgi:tRNA wybutosine-synthesizing protein 1